MNFELPDTALQLQDTIRRWVDSEVPRRGIVEAYTEGQWRNFLQWELLDVDFGDYFHRAVGLMEVVRAGLPGPVLESYLALRADTTTSASVALRDGAVVTSVTQNRKGPLLVGWGAVASLVVDQQTGATLAKSPLQRAEFAYPVPHGWLSHDDVVVNDSLRGDRWYVGAALLAGLVAGALELTTEHVLVRHQFGKPLGSFQAVQFPLAELKVWSDGVRFMVLDAALRRDRGDASWEVAAAMAWLNAVRAARLATKACHQSFGALGFCNETGLVQLTSGMSWLRMSVGVDAAHSYVLDSRENFLNEHSGDEPPSLVLEGSWV
jgi:hypothetical protein